MGRARKEAARAAATGSFPPGATPPTVPWRDGEPRFVDAGSEQTNIPGSAAKRGRALLRWHGGAVVVFSVALLAVVTSTARGSGVNPLVLAPRLPVLLLGLPWSAGELLATLAPHPSRPDPGQTGTVVLVIAAALLNLALHAGLARHRRTRHDRARAHRT